MPLWIESILTRQIRVERLCRELQVEGKVARVETQGLQLQDIEEHRPDQGDDEQQQSDPTSGGVTRHSSPERSNRIAGSEPTSEGRFGCILKPSGATHDPPGLPIDG